MNYDLVEEKFVKLALAIDQHRQGYIDSYFGYDGWIAEVVRQGTHRHCLN